jgi:flagellar basal-body rod protein FlgC
MAMFGAIDAASSGASVARVWLDAISDNVANVNTVRPAGEEPFRARMVVARSVDGANGVGQGVATAGIISKPGEPVRAYDPGNPLADENGYVTRPLVDLTEEMTNLLIATRTYQANLSVIDRARDAYMAALQIGRR